MRISKSTHCLIIAGLFALATPCVYANTSASVAVTNLSSQAKLSIACTLSNDTDFYRPSHNKHKQIFRIYDRHGISIDIEKHGAQPSTAPNMICIELGNASNWFTYTIIEPYYEKVATHGQFSYDPDYQGSLLFNDPN